MARRFDTRKRNNAHRKTNPVILLIAEGTNETESKYFSSFQHQHAGYTIIVLKTGHKTDPEGMLKKLEDYWVEKNLDAERGDIAFVVVDLDCSKAKTQLIDRLSKTITITEFVVSNPCFEVWFLLHFRYSTKSFLSSYEVINELKKYIPDYQKNSDVAGLIKPNLPQAVRNAQRLEAYHCDNMNRWPSNDCNPRTDVAKVILAIEERKGSEGHSVFSN